MKISINADEAVKDAIRQIKDASIEKRAKIKWAIQETTEKVFENAKRKAPLGKTGNLRKGIEMEMYRNGNAGIVKATAPHSHLVELGTNPRFTAPKKKKALKINDKFVSGFISTGKMKPKPFLKPAAEEEHANFVARLEEAIK